MNDNAPRKVPCAVYSRITGYLRPVQYWNKAKQQEFKDRTVYNVKGEREREGAQIGGM